MIGISHEKSRYRNKPHNFENEVKTKARIQMKDPLKQIARLSNMPEYGSEEYKNWIQQYDFIHFLQSQSDSDQIVIYAESPYILGILVPENLVSPPKVDNLERWGFDPYYAWRIELVRGEQPDVTIIRVLDHEGSETYRQGEQIVFIRGFPDRPYIEISQKFSHALGIHYDPERRVFSRLDPDGDLENVVNISRVPSQNHPQTKSYVVTFLRNTLDEYLTLTNQALILLYISSRENFQASKLTQLRDVNHYETQPEIFFRLGLIRGEINNLAGFQIIRSRIQKKDLIERIEPHYFNIIKEPPEIYTGF